MSVRVMSLVWDDGPQDQTELLVLLALADFSNDAGECWPSMIGIAEKARLTERGARGIMRRLEADGWVKTIIGGGRGGKNRYQITVTKGGTTNREPQTGNVKTRNVTALNPERGDTKPGTSVPPNHQEPSREPSIDSVAAKKRRRPEGELPIDWVPSDRNRTDAEARQFSATEIEHEADKFRNHHHAKGTRFRDWDAAWRTWLANARSFKTGNARTGSAHQELFAGFQRAASRIS